MCPICTEEEQLERAANNINGDQPKESQYQKANSKQKTLKIMQLNIDSLRSKVEELKVFLNHHKVDVFAIQETKLTSNITTPTIPGYCVVCKDRKQPKAKRGTEEEE